MIRRTGMVARTCGGAAILALLAMAGAVVLGGSAARAEEVAGPPDIARLIRELGDDRFVTRRRAERLLGELGEQALPALMEAAKSHSAETRYRARRIAREIEHRFLTAAFTRLGERQDGDIDLEEAMWLVARVVDPMAERETSSRAFDEMARGVRKRLGEADPRAADPRRVVDALRHELFETHGLRGNAENYGDPDNSAVHRVLANRKGLPILLSMVMVAVGRRLDVPIVGLAVPGRYMVKYHGARGPAGFAHEDIVVDPYGGGRVMDRRALAEFFGVPQDEFDAETFLESASNRATVVRMLSNLRTSYERAGQSDKAGRIAEYMARMDVGELDFDLP